MTHGTTGFCGGTRDQTMADCINALKEWTRKSTATVLFDSAVDEFTSRGLLDNIRGKPNIAVVGFTTDGDVFGGYFSVAVSPQWEEYRDPDIFAFSFESHGRCETPQRFLVRYSLMDKAFLRLARAETSDFRVEFYVPRRGGFRLGNDRTGSWCSNVALAFGSLGNTTLTGTNFTSNQFHCTRLLAVQLA